MALFNSAENNSAPNVLKIGGIMHSVYCVKLIKNKSCFSSEQRRSEDGSRSGQQRSREGGGRYAGSGDTLDRSSR